jgi:UDPglucose 6-dehydrogenase
MANIAVISTGYVGLVFGACLADFGNTVSCVDVDEKKSKASGQDTSPSTSQAFPMSWRGT